MVMVSDPGFSPGKPGRRNADGNAEKRRGGGSLVTCTTRQQRVRRRHLATVAGTPKKVPEGNACESALAPRMRGAGVRSSGNGHIVPCDICGTGAALNGAACGARMEAPFASFTKSLESEPKKK